MGSKSVTSSYWYKLIAHLGLCKGPIDWLSEIRGGDRVAWTGRRETSGIINVYAPELYGGEKAEGGIDGQFELMMGESDQAPNDYLALHIGAAQPGYRGRATIVIRGAKIGAGNPYPKTLYFKLCRILKGWDDDVCWYPEKAPIPILEGTIGSSPGGPGVPDGFGFNVGQQVGVTAIPSGGFLLDPLMCTLEMAELYGFTYTPIEDSAFWFWRANESGLCFVKFGESDEGAVVSLVDDGWEVGDTALMKFNSGQLTMVVLTSTGTAPPAPDGYVWNAGNGGSSIATGIGTVYLWTHPLDYLGLNVPSDPGSSGTPPICYMNPAHILYDSITSRRENGGMGEPIGRIDEPSFTAAADRLYDEGFGLCCTWYGGESTEAFQQRILNVIGGSLSQSRRDGKFYLDLLREVADIDALPFITDDDITDWEAEPAVPPESINQIQVKWFDPETREQRITGPVQSLGAIQDAGGLFADIREYNEIPYEALANRVAQRDLNSVSSALWKLTFSCRRRSYDLRPGMQIRLLCPNRGFDDIVVVIGDVDYGRIGEEEVRIIALQDVFALPDASFVNPQGSLDNDPAPGEDDDSKTEAVMEAPYFQVVSVLTPSEYADIVDETSGFLLTAKSAPPRGTNYRIYTRQGSDEYTTVANGDFCPSAKSVNEVGPLDEVDIVIEDESLMDRVAVGDWALWDGEIRRVDALAPGLVSLASGCADTLPRKHDAGSMILFVGEWAGTDEKEYVTGEEVDVKLPASGYGQDQLLADATEHTVTFAQRQARPYPPGDLKINGVSVFGIAHPGSPGGGPGAPTGPVPTTPPATGSNGGPASNTPGPNGGFPDNAPPLFPVPTTFGSNIVDDPSMDDPDTLPRWRKRDGTPLGSEWSLVGGKLQLQAGPGTYEAYDFGTRLSVPHTAFPRLVIDTAGDLQNAPGSTSAVGTAWGTWQSSNLPQYFEMSAAAEHLTETTVTHSWAPEVGDAGGGVGLIGEYPVIIFVPMVRHVVTSGFLIATLDNVSMEITKIDPPLVSESPTNIDLSGGLAGISLHPDPLDTNPYVADISVVGGVAIADFHTENFDYRWLIFDDPLVSVDLNHFVRFRIKGWSDDDTILSNSSNKFYPFGGVVPGLAYKNPLGEVTALATAGRVERGDFTPREYYQRVNIAASSGYTVHAAVLMVGSVGKLAKFKDLEVDTTVSAYP